MNNTLFIDNRTSISGVHLHKNKQSGFTMVELMIAMVISLVLLLVIGTVFVSSNQAFRVQDDNARLQESGRFTLEMLARNIKQAGSANIPFDGNKVLFEGDAVTGTAGADGAPDTLTIQYESMVGEQNCEGTAVTTAGDIIQNHFNLDVANAELQCAGSIVTPPATPAAPGASPTGEPLLSNIEDLQVLYGINTSVDNQSANQYVETPGDWSQVVSIRICVLVRSENTNVTSSGYQYRDCNNAAQSSADGRIRRAFTSTFNMRNRVNELP